MSSKLKVRSPKENPKNKKYKQDRKFAEHCYSEIFTSMQLICVSTLHSSEEDGGFDFTVKKLQNFNKFTTLHNEENIAGKLKSKDTENKLREWGFDCEKRAAVFPYRAKVKMICGDRPVNKVKNFNILLCSADVAIRAYLILVVHTLRTHYRFSLDDVNRWWDKMLEVGGLYAKGMTDEWVISFIKDDSGLEIVK